MKSISYHALLFLVAVSSVTLEVAFSQGQCSLQRDSRSCEANDCIWCTTDGNPYCAEEGACPTLGDRCNATQYCCPDAKACLTPTNRTCKSSADACLKGEACCPITKICVIPGNPCKSPCEDKGSYCCPDALHCLTPVNPGVFCDPKDSNSCADGEVCCPVTKLCVRIGEKCSLTPKFMSVRTFLKWVWWLAIETIAGGEGTSAINSLLFISFSSLCKPMWGDSY